MPKPFGKSDPDFSSSFGFQNTGFSDKNFGPAQEVVARLDLETMEFRGKRLEIILDPREEFGQGTQVLLDGRPFSGIIDINLKLHMGRRPQMEIKFFPRLFGLGEPVGVKEKK